jgi:DNA-binding beta-propeller fold protein YncE
MFGPQAVATDAEGNVYVTELFGQRIEKFDSSGNWLSAWGKGVNGGNAFGICTVAASCQAGSIGALGGEMFSPRAVAIDSAGSAYVADFANDRIQKFR